MKCKSSLLEMAKGLSKAPPPEASEQTLQELEVAVAWVNGELTNKQVMAVLGINWTTGMYCRLAVLLRNGGTTGVISITLNAKKGEVS